MRVVFEQVQVQPASSGAPQFVIWGKRSLRTLEVLDFWRFGGEWWLGGYPRDYFLIRFPSLTAELYREDRSHRLPGYQLDETELWVLARIAD